MRVAPRSGRLQPSERQWLVLGLNLMRLLSRNRIAEFHTELELLPPVALTHPLIRYPVQVEQWLMEGSYNKVAKGRAQLPAAEYAPFIDTLAITIRYARARARARVRCSVRTARPRPSCSRRAHTPWPLPRAHPGAAASRTPRGRCLAHTPGPLPRAACQERGCRLLRGSVYEPHVCRGRAAHVLPDRGCAVGARRGGTAPLPRVPDLATPTCAAGSANSAAWPGRVGGGAPQKSWLVDRERNVITFQTPAPPLSREDIPAHALIQQTLQYALELERIV